MKKNSPTESERKEEIVQFKVMKQTSIFGAPYRERILKVIGSTSETLNMHREQSRRRPLN